jgi:hypothetical protein
MKLEEDIHCFPSGTFPILFEDGEFGSSLYLHVCLIALQSCSMSQCHNDGTQIIWLIVIMKQ